LLISDAVHRHQDRRRRGLDREISPITARNDQVRVPVDHPSRDLGHPVGQASDIAAFDDL